MKSKRTFHHSQTNLLKKITTKAADAQTIKKVMAPLVKILHMETFSFNGSENYFC